MDLRLSMILDAVDRFTQPIRRITQTTQRATQQIRNTQDTLSQLNSTAGDIENFRRFRTQIRQTSSHLQAAQQRVSRLAREMQNSGRVTASMRRQFQSARREAANLANQHREQQQRLQQLRNGLRQAGVSTNDLRNAQRRLREEIERQNRALRQQQERLQRLRQVQQQTERARQRISQGAGNVAAGAGTMAAGGATAFGLAQGAIQTDNFATILAAQKGLSTEQQAIYQDMINNISKSTSSSNEKIFSSIYAVTGAFGGLGKQSQESIIEMTKQADAFTKVYQIDAAQSIQSVQQLIQNGLAKSSTEAFDLLTKGFQSMSVEMGRELPEILNQYGTYFRALGFSGSESMALLISASQKGKFALDKTGDALKEFTLRGSDMSKSSKEAFDLIGLSANDMATMITKGGTDSRLALMQTAQGLLDIQDPVQRAYAARALFGTPLEDLSIDEIPQLLDVLSKYGKDLEGFTGAIQRMMNQIAQGTSEKLGRAWNELNVAKNKVISEALPVITSLLEKITSFMSENPKLTAALITFISIMGVLSIVGGAIMLIVGGFTALSGVVTLLKQKMLLLNGAFLANPITWIVLGVVALIAAGYLLIKNWDKVKEFFIGLWDTLKNIFSSGIEFIKNIFLSPLETIKNTVGWLWNKIFGDDDKEVTATVKKIEEQVPNTKNNVAPGYQSYINQNQPAYAGYGYSGYNPYQKPEIKTAAKVGTVLPNTRQANLTTTNNIVINSTAENPQDVAAEVRKQLEERDRNNASSYRGLMID